MEILEKIEELCYKGNIELNYYERLWTMNASRNDEEPHIESHKRLNKVLKRMYRFLRKVEIPIDTINPDAGPRKKRKSKKHADIEEEATKDIFS